MTAPADPDTKPVMAAQMLKFGVAGVTGFAIDAGLTLAFTSWLGWSPYLARLVSFTIALLATWTINRLWTFQSKASSARNVGVELLSYGAVQLTGGALNYAVYAVVIALLGKTPLMLVLAIAAGSGAGMVLNFLGARYLVFRKR